MQSLRRGRLTTDLRPYTWIITRHHGRPPALHSSRTIINGTPRFSSGAPPTGNGASSAPPPPPPPIEFLDVPYFEGEDACKVKHRLDVYIPGAPFPRPRSRTCLFVHGGSWQRGDRRHPVVPGEFYGKVGRTLARAGMVGLVMSYRLAPEVQHPEQVRDVARAVRWAKENVSRYGGDPRDLVLIGHSAGAHLAALCLSDPQWLAEQGLVVSITPPSTSTSPPLAPPRPNTPSVSFDGSISNRNNDIDTFSKGIMRETCPDRSTLPTISEGTEKGQTTTTTSSQQQISCGSQSASPPQSTGPGRSPSRRSLQPPLQPRSQSPVVTAFVGISGVYDIPRMAGNVVGQMLARVAFGDERWGWRRVSPVHIVLETGANPRGGSVTAPDGETAAASNSTARLSPLAARSAKETPRSLPPAGVLETDDWAGSTSSGGESSEQSRRSARELVRDEHRTSSFTPPQENIRAHKMPRQLYSSLCPLVTTDVLLITALSDFHLREDAQALAQALEGARREMAGALAVPRWPRGLPEGQSGNRTTLDRNAAAASVVMNAAAGGDDLIGKQNRDAAGSEYDGSEACSGVRCGSVRHVCLQGEDHLSTIISFGESGKESSDVVLGFILGLRRPPPSSL